MFTSACESYPAVLTEEQLQAYGLPLRPPDSKDQARWLQLANRIKLDRHICNPKPVTGYLAHQSTYPSHKYQNTNPWVTGYNSQYFAGNYATGSPGDYTFSSANWNLPCMNTSVRNARASFWLGLGGFGANGYLVQAGTDVNVDGSGNVSYTVWIESTASKDYRDTWDLPYGQCGNTMYIEVDSNFEGDGIDYFVIDGGGANITTDQNWPTSVGDTGECMVERLFDKSSGNYYPLADFNYIAFSNCLIDGNGIGNLSHNYDVMVNSSGTKLAAPGSISGGSNYHVNWYRAS